MSIGDSTQRFSSRVADYVRYRPGYPPVIVETLKSDCALTAASVMADVGSGTGFLARVFLENGNRVYGIEPNKEMREAGEQLLKEWPEYRSVSATAEATTLAAESVDFVTAGQAAHWFRREKARREFLRILRPGAWLVLVWNDRATDSTPLLRAYEQLLQSHCPEYPEVRRIDLNALSKIERFFHPAPMRATTFASHQLFDFEGLKGRLLSSSYTPQEGDPNHAPMLRELSSIFERYQANGRVVFAYETKMYYGQIA